MHYISESGTQGKSRFFLADVGEFAEIRKFSVCDFLLLVWLIARSIMVNHVSAYTRTTLSLTYKFETNRK